MQPKAVPIETPECVPEIQIKEKLVFIDPWLARTHENPTIPSHGDNSDLLDWAMECAVNNRMLNDQMRAIQELGHE